MRCVWLVRQELRLSPSRRLDPIVRFEGRMRKARPSKCGPGKLCENAIPDNCGAAGPPQSSPDFPQSGGRNHEAAARPRRGIAGSLHAVVRSRCFSPSERISADFEATQFPRVALRSRINVGKAGPRSPAGGDNWRARPGSLHNPANRAGAGGPWTKGHPQQCQSSYRLGVICWSPFRFWVAKGS